MLVKQNKNTNELNGGNPENKRQLEWCMWQKKFSSAVTCLKTTYSTVPGCSRN